MMEERRLEHQRRLLAMRTAAPSLPSSQEKEFNLRLVDLYKEQPCLWNTALPEHKDAELKRSAWEKIAGQLGSHLSAEFVRCRVRSMRYHLNVYKLQMIEYQMTSGEGKQPEKPFYVDRFAFLDSEGALPDTKRGAPGVEPGKERDSISGKYAKLWSDFNLKSLAKRETGTTNPEHRRSGPSILGMVKMRMEADRKPLEFALPRLGITQMQRSLTRNRARGQTTSASSLEALSETPPALQARPGDSISKTKLAQKDRDTEKPTTSKMAQASLAEAQSEDDELYSLHWSVRKEQRSLRPGHEQRQRFPVGLHATQPNEPTPDIF
ncbi:uncharacterized protein LOC108035759 [Drosophila biarmipes]|uniref:uncharacterized protein LOC108035759 n=1 Tax=Drosophila biarmipes TaxID=125945 RepID=UPI0007E63EBB|nr:uncharacterized protein LOC108035759 [Drosophila biarmipes]